jgi:N12 class adenine-specific DNA methylase
MADPIVVDPSAWAPLDPLGLFSTPQPAPQSATAQPEPAPRPAVTDQQQPAPGISRTEQPDVAAAASVDDDMDGYAQRVKMQESSGRVNAKNPRSSATGLYQFTDDTWAAVAAKNPGLGLTPDGRFDPDQQQRAMEALTKDNAGFLSRKGLPTDGGSLYAAHFLGAPSAARVLAADDATPIASIVGDDVMRRNPNLAGMSVGDFKAWTSRVGNGGDTPPRPPRDVPSAAGAPEGPPPENTDGATRGAVMQASTAPEGRAGRSEAGPVAPPEFFQIAGDLSERAPFVRRKMESPQGLVIHHTGGRGTPEGIMEVFRQRGLATQYIMDREGQVFRALPDGTMGRHLRPSEINGLSNSNAIGIEIIARDDADVTPKQRFAARNFINYASSRYGFDRSNVFGHGELNSHKQSTEGMSSVGDWRQYKGLDGPASSTAVAAAPPQSMRDRTLMAYAGGDEPRNASRAANPASSAVAQAPGAARPDSAATIPRGAAIVADADFRPVDPGGLWGDYRPPARGASVQPVVASAPVAAPPPPPEIETALNADPRRKGPGQWRYVDDIDAWEKEWKDKNASTGLLGDTKRLLTMGAESIPQALSEVVRAIPKVGPIIVDGLDAVDRWMTGKGSQEIFEENKAKAAAGLTSATKEAREKKWVDEIKRPDGSITYMPGKAWTDPRSYISGITESLPGTAVTMTPALVLARGAYGAALAQGASQKVAAAAAARTALIAGAVGEGILGGGQAASEVRERIGKLSPDVLKSSEAYQSLIREGKTPEQAIDALTNDSAAQAVLIAGVASAAFGGIGDRALAQIVAEGVGGGLAKRIVRGAGRGAATGVLEEVPQEVAQQATQNLVIQRIDPNQRLAEGLPNAAAGGAVMGGIMGGGIGAVGGAASPRAPGEQPPETAAPGIGPAPTGTAPTGPVAPEKGPLAAAVQYGQQQQPAAPSAGAASAPTPSVPDGAPAIGSTVTIEADEFGSFPGRIEGYEAGEALVADLTTGELMQVPISALRGRVPASQIPLSGAPPADVEPVAPGIQPRGTDARGPAIPMSPQEKADLEAKRREPGWRNIDGEPKASRRGATDADPDITAPAGVALTRTDSDADGPTRRNDTTILVRQVTAAAATDSSTFAAAHSGKQGKFVALVSETTLNLIFDGATPSKSGGQLLANGSIGSPTDINPVRYFDTALEAHNAARVATGYEPLAQKAPRRGRKAADRDMTPVDMTGVPPASEDTPAAKRTSALPPASETEPVGGRAGLGGVVPGGRVIVDAAGVDRFPATIEAFVGSEAVVRRDDGTSLQVPMSTIRVSSLSRKEREAKERTENPPVPREQAQGPTIRRVNGRPVEFPDDLHARLFDLGRLRRDSMRQTGGGKLDMNRVSPSEQAALAAAFKMGDQELGQLADDYRYRAEKFARDARSDLPTKMHTVNEKLQKRLEADARRRAKESFDAAPEKQAAPSSAPSAPTAPAVPAVPTIEDAAARPGEKYDAAFNRIFRNMETLIDRLEEAAEKVAGAPSVEVAAADARAFLAAVPKFVREIDQGTQYGNFDQFEPLIAKIIKGGLAPAPKKTADAGAKTEIDRRANEAATSPTNDRPEPTEAQKKAGNYKVGDISLAGLEISIENPAGSIRSGVDKGGKAWAVTMRQHYGYIRGTKGKDKDHIDVFVRPGLAKVDDADLAFVVDQIVDGEFDEHKPMLGYGSRRAAENAYRGAYEKGWKGMGSVTKTTVAEFKQWLAEGNKEQPFAVWAAGQQDTARAEQRREPAAATPEAPAARRRNWDVTVDELRAGVSDTSLATGYVDRMVLRAWVAQLSDADYQKLADWKVYNFPIILSDTMEPARMLAAFQLSLKNDRATTIDPDADPRVGSYADNLERTKRDLLAGDQTPAGSVIGFKTAKGSQYIVHSDGTTTRNKAARNDAGHEGDSGPKPRTAMTVYVAGDASALSAAGLQNLGPRGSRLVIRDGKATLLTWNETARNGLGAWGAAPSGRDIAIFTEPAVGRSPLELWGRVDDNGAPVGPDRKYAAFSRQHAGNPIVELQTSGAQPPAKVGASPARAEPASAAPKASAPAMVTWGDAKPVNINEGDGAAPGLAVQARRVVTERGKATGREYLIGIDDRGQVVLNGAGNEANTNMTVEALAKLDDPAQNIVVHHNHPSGSSFSPSDIAFLASPGIAVVYAHGHNDLSFRAALTPDARSLIAGMSPKDARKEIGQIAIYANDRVFKPVNLLTRKGTVSVADAKAAHSHIAATILSQAGVIDYNATVAPEATKRVLAALPADFIEKEARNVRVTYIDGKVEGGPDRDDRRAVAVRHPGDVGIVFEGTQGRQAGSAVADADPPSRVDDQAEAQQVAPAPPAAAAADPFAANTLFTADKVAAARARLKSKLSQLNSGIDPEVLVDGMTIAGAYIEAGIRDFGEYASRMKSDFGDSIVPYLLSFWEGARNYPGLNTDGMTATEKSRELHTKLLGTADLTAVEPVIGKNLAKPEKPKRKTGAASDMVLTQDWGVPHIDGYGTSNTREIGNDTKDAFLKEARSYLNQVASLLAERGFQPHVDRNGKPMKPVSVNESGPAGSGEVSLTMVHPDGTGIYANIGDTSLRNVVPHTASGIAIMYRTATKDDRYGVRGQNRWAPVDLSAADITEVFAKEAAKGMPRPTAAVTLARPDDTLPLFARPSNEQPAKLDQSSPGTLEGAPSGQIRPSEEGRDAERSPEGGGGADVSGDRPARSAGSGSRDSVADGEGVVPDPESRAGGGRAANTDDDATPAGPGSRASRPDAAERSGPGGNGRDRAADGVREPANPGSVDADPAAAPASGIPSPVLGGDYTLSDADDIGAGGPKAKYRANIAAIEIVRRTTAEKRGATVAEQAALAKWVGWGGLSAAFVRPDGSVAKGWDKEAAELKALLTPDEYAAARASTRNAHYTSPEVVQAMWTAVERMGFKRGAVLEPSVGAGNFLGFMPPAIRDGARVTAVELDAITGAIAALLYPTSSVKSPIGFQDLIVPDNHFDLAIGNPPFGSERLYDGKRKAISKFSIHNYFFAKSIETLRPGGILAMVITSRFLDGADGKARKYIADRADLIGAIRLPNTAFLANAGTEVTTDIIFLRKREPGDAVGDTSWIDVKTHRDAEGREVPLNAYFVAKSDMMLGEFGAYGTMYGPDEPALRGRPGDDLPALLAAAIQTLPQNIAAKPGADVQVEAPVAPMDVADTPVGSFYMAPDGTVMKRLEDRMGDAQAEPVQFKDERSRERVAGMIRLRDAFARLRAAQLSSAPDADDISNRLRDRLNRVYDAFVKANGPVNTDANKRLFRADPTWPQVSALENNFDKGVSDTVSKTTGEAPRKPSATKAAIFSKRTQRPYAKVDRAANAKDALAATLSDVGRLDLDAIAAIYPKSRDEIVEELGSLVYELPGGGYDTSDRYLSGNVKQKLAEAERAAASEPRLQRNVDALRAVIPADIEAIDIEVKIGSPWIPNRDVAAFVEHIADARGARVAWNAGNAQWSVDPPQPSPSAQTRWSTERTRVGDIIIAALNGKQIKIYDRNDDGTATLNAAQTQAAAEKVEAVAQEWRNWIWQDDSRRDQLARIYNDTFNTDRKPVYDGRHLTLPGKVSDDVIALRPHQLDFVWRALQSGIVLADHTVGAGKTFSAIAAVMEMRRTGKARKPMIVVPNHLVGQWATDFIKLYPGAQILSTQKNDFNLENRQRLFSRVASGDWDAVIVAHSSFGRIGVHPNIQAEFTQEEIDSVTQSIEALRGDKDTASKRTVKQLEKQRVTLQTKLKSQLDAGSKDVGITFDDLGVDALVVDEAHEFKNLAYSTSMQRVAGLGNQKGSDRAADLYMKTQTLLARTGGNNVMFLTGTPLSNTMAEMYTLQRYLDRKALRNMGLAHFDAWARVFGEVVTDWELSPSGSYKMNSRFAKFVNLPELMQRYQSFADVITNDDIKRQLAEIGQVLPLPKVKGGKPRNIVVERSRDQAAFIGTPNEDGQYPRDSLVWRAENLPKKVEKGSDNMLKIMGDARKAALDMRLISPDYGDPPGGKVWIAADEITRIWRSSSAVRGTQLVFIDLSTPKAAKAKENKRIRELLALAEEGDKAAQEQVDALTPDELMSLDGDFSVYDDLKQKLIDRGIPSEEIAFVHDANTDEQKELLFGKVRSGRIRILFGSTPRMGAGTNVQNRLVALHHLDAPWRPSDLEQRDGRGIRQGNELYAADPDGFELEILRYATEKTLDARQWQTIESKAKFIGQMRKGATGMRTVEDIGGEAANSAEMKAAASGNPLILEEMDLRQKLRKLEGARQQHDREQFAVRDRLRLVREEGAALRRRAPKVEADAATVTEALKTEVPATINGAALTKPSEIGAAVLAAARARIKGQPGPLSGSVLGLDAELDSNPVNRAAFTLTLSGQIDHNVFIADVEVADATGLGVRILNAAKATVEAPKITANRIREIERQLPQMEAQIAPWPGAAELELARERHSKVIDELRPKKPPGGEAQGEAKASVSETMTDSDTLDPGSMQDLAQLVRNIANQVVGDKAVNVETAPSISRDRLNDAAVQASGAATDRVRILGLFETNAPGGKGPIGSLISVSLGGMDRFGIAETTYHEAWHALDVLGLIPARDAMLLERNTDQMRAALRKRLPRHNLAAMEPDEVRAYTFGFYAGDVTEGRLAGRGLPVMVRQVMTRAVNMLRRIRNGLNGMGFRTVQDVFDAAIAGEFRATSPPVLAMAPVGRASVAIDGDTPQKRDARFRQELRGRSTDMKPAMLSLVPLNYFTELKRPNMGAVDAYLEAKRKMDAYRGQKHGDADAIAQQWLAYTRLGLTEGGKTKGRELADLMHEATLSGIDPSFDASDFIEGAPAGHGALRKRFLALSPKGRQLFETVRDAYLKQSLELDKIIIDNVDKAMWIARKQAADAYFKERERIERNPNLSKQERSEQLEAARKARALAATKGEWMAKARLTKLRIAFEQSRVPAPYFPLGRFGRFFVTAKDIDGTILSFSRFERSADRDRAAVSIREEVARTHPGATVEAGVLDNGSEVRQAMDPRIIAQIETLLGQAGVDDAVLDAIWQRYLQTMPDLSMRKRAIHRKGTAGYERDALRTFASHMFHASHQMARVKYGLDLQEHLNEASEQARMSDDTTRGQMLVNELRLRHEWVMNPTGSKAAQFVTSAMFTWYLAASPAAALVNLSQTVMLGIPILGARLGGVGKASAAILRASKDFIGGGGDARKAKITADERAALDAFYDSGLVDRTQSHELAGVGDTGVQYSPVRAKVMGIIAWAFHKAEVMNREVTALAAYRLARGQGESHRTAVNTAHELTWKAHFDYANSSRARVMQGDTAKVLLVFQNYQLNMWYRLMRDTHQALKGESPAAKREARYQLAGVVGMMTMLAGVTGVAGYNVLMAIAGMFFDDEDDPRDFKAEMEGHVLTLFGPDIGRMILKGVPGQLARIDLTSRLGMPDFFLRMPDGNSEGRNWYRDLIVAALGVTGSTIVSTGQGLHLISQGNLQRGAELLVPKAIADIMKSYRFANEGILNVRGDPILERERLDAWDIIARGTGFTSARIAEGYERNRRLREAEADVLKERRKLVNAWALTRLAGDDEGRTKALAAIQQWNQKPYAKGLRITQDTLAQSLQTRRLNSRRRDDGVVIENKQLRRHLQGLMPERAY